MTSDREVEVVEAFVALATSLAVGLDVVDLLSELTDQCTALLDVNTAGLLLADSRGNLHVAAASSERAHNLELFQLQREEGPCLDCYHSGQPVAVTDLDEAADRWPQFTAAAAAADIHSVHAVPLRLREMTLGALGLFGTGTGRLNPADLTLGQALADVASVALVTERAAADRDLVVEQLQTALDSRVVLEQAKGLLAERGDLTMDQAFAYLRQYARDHNLRLSDLGSSLVHRDLATDEVIRHARARHR